MLAIALVHARRVCALESSSLGLSSRGGGAISTTAKLRGVWVWPNIFRVSQPADLYYVCKHTLHVKVVWLRSVRAILCIHSTIAIATEEANPAHTTTGIRYNYYSMYTILLVVYVVIIMTQVKDPTIMQCNHLVET